MGNYKPGSLNQLAENPTWQRHQNTKPLPSTRCRVLLTNWWKNLPIRTGTLDITQFLKLLKSRGLDSWNFCSVYNLLFWFSGRQIINKVSEELSEYTESLEGISKNDLKEKKKKVMKLNLGIWLGCNYPLETQFHQHSTSRMSKTQHDSVIEICLPSIHITALYFTWTCSSCQAKKNLIISFSTQEPFQFSK